jgi:hypothetical protein
MLRSRLLLTATNPRLLDIECLFYRSRSVLRANGTNVYADILTTIPLRITPGSGQLLRLPHPLNSRLAGDWTRTRGCTSSNPAGER